jgi:hypothetical protein
MKRLILPMMGALAILPVQAQLHVPAQRIQQAVDPANVIIDRGSKLEIFPTQRAIPQTRRSGSADSYSVTTAAAETPIGPRSLGVVFNYAMQQQGYISGEIAFRMKPGYTATGFDSSLYPGLKKVANPEVYVVNARTPAEFLAVLNRLQTRSDLTWVEPIVTYSASNPNGAIR